MNEPSHLFVYGTLRLESAHPKARRLRMQARHVGKGLVPGRLYDLGYYPAAVFHRDETLRIVGDVFALKPDGRLLAEMDAYEAWDPFYERRPLEVKLLVGGTIMAWAYGVTTPPRARLITGGDFIAHHRNRLRRNRCRPRAVRP